MKTNSAIIKLEYKCNNRCIFCHCHHNRIDSNNRHSFFKLLDLLPDSVSRVLLSGGEPTIYSDLKNVLTELRKKNLKSGFISNGRRFAYLDFCKYVISMGADYFYISLHSHDAQIHDFITGCENAWSETIKGLENLTRFSARLDITVNCVVVRKNAEQLKPLVSLMAQVNVKKIKFSVPEIKGLAGRDTEQKLLPLDEAAKCIVDAIDFGTEIGLVCTWDGLPYCYIPDHFRDNQNNLENNRIYYMSEVFEDSFYLTDESKRHKPSNCNLCAFNGVCTGYYAGYEKHGTVQVKPITTPVPNYFELKKMGELDLSPTKCVRESKTHRLRMPPHGLALFFDSQATLFEAESKHFKQSDYFRAKDRRQFYINGAVGKMGHRIDDLRQLRLLPLCQNCETQCLGMYHTDGDSRFFSLSPDMTAVLNGLTGSVLDVGCGEVYLADLFFETLKESIVYTGIEPDETRYDAVRKQYPNAAFVNCTLENAHFERDSFDVVLMLGSYQHIENLTKALINVKRMLKANGRLIVIENVVFGLIESEKSSSSFTVAQDSGYEHYRNDELEEAAQLLDRFGFCVQQRETISPYSNFWMLTAVPKVNQ